MEKSGEKFLSFHQPTIESDEINEVVDTLQSGWITTGPKTKLFEEKFREYIGNQYAIAVNSCTAGLHLSLVAAGIGEGDEVITSPYTFAATGEVIVQVRAKPIFVDVEKDSLNIDPEEIRKVITPRTKAIIPVHFAGQPCRMTEIMEIAREYNLIIIEDAAHALAAEYNGEKIGNIGHITVFSFYATKNITTGEGGMVTTNDPALAEKIRLLSLHGLSRDAWKRYSAEGSWYYEIIDSGYKYNMTDIQAALGLHQLTKLERFQQIREGIVKTYDRGFETVPEVLLPFRNESTKHAWHLYVIKLDVNSININRAEFINELAARNIGTSVHFIPLHLHPFYRDHYVFDGGFPNAEYAYERVVSLPLYPALNDEDLQYVIESVKEIVTRHRKY
jgi:dTDP-4-amino-4,6-dideoxygalactose transaminase